MNTLEHHDNPHHAANRHEPKDAILRQWLMLQMIPREPAGITVSQLRERLMNLDPLYTVHRRTIERNLNQLMSVFPALDFRESPAGNLWFWERDTVMDVPRLDVKSALMFRLAENFLTPMFPRATLDDLRPHFRQAERALRESGHHGYSDWPEKIQLIQNSIQLQHPEVNPDILAIVYDALFQDRQFSMLYRNRGGEERNFLVSPRGLVFRDGIIYLVATLHNYTDLKQLPLHRMLAAELTDQAVQPLPGFNLKRYVSAYFDYPLHALPSRGDAEHPTPENLTIEIAMHAIAAVHLKESPLGSDQTSEAMADGRIRFRATVANTERLRWWLLSYGPGIEVLAPQYLREEMMAKAQEMAGIYGSN
ncbi:MAG: hypothetical protein RIQ52_1547 [Pseudomonadota bacterium]